MQKRGDVAFSTIVVVIIAAAVLIMVLIWIIPQFSELFGKTSDVEDIAVGDLDKLECEKSCLDAQALETVLSTTPYCEKECKTAYNVDCEGVSCP